jgi:hypothetical protein
MTSDDPNHVRDEEIATVRGEEPTDTAQSQDSDSTDTGDRVDTADATDEAGIAAPNGASDTGVMMDAADTGTIDQADVAAPSGATDTGMMMDARDTGTVDRTDVGEREAADADESDQ